MYKGGNLGSSLCIQFSTHVNQEILVRIFGGFLVLLSVYYLFFNKNTGPKEMSKPMSALYIVASGLCDGLFGIGGPLMVIYFLNLTQDKKEYLGTMQAFSILNVLWNTLFRLCSGILTPAHLPMIAAGMAAILIASILAKTAVEKIDDAKLRKMTYLLIGISGLLNVL
ncbi:sulfite exporter TauE/SafE family protein [Allobaculum sp. JKK-2023]|uniref:sulfite exporter TauE/SafE family protein n=1 Tax=Allobaculum sp. JKK-2023 TaxID=3108943 RepID=UPI002B05E85C|nr:sulfite exporter TauE/SafE family protein [Allobaculum sp. JKK-2023]